MMNKNSIAPGFMIKHIINKMNRIENDVIQPDEKVTIIRSNYGWNIFDFKELKEYRDLLFFLV